MKNLEIKITAKDIRKHYSDSERVVCELAYSIGSWTEADVWEENAMYERYAFPQILKDFDFEDSLLKATRTDKGLRAVAKALEFTLIPIIGKSALQAGARMALEMPHDWADLLKAYSDTCEAQADEYEDSSFLSNYAPELQKELSQSVQWSQENAMQEWLYGDRSTRGVLRQISDEYGAESYSYDTKADVYTFYFDTEEARHRLLNWDGSKLTKANYKKYVLLDIFEKSDMHFREKEERRNERKQKREQQEKLRQEREAERIKKLKSLKK